MYPIHERVDYKTSQFPLIIYHFESIDAATSLVKKIALTDHSRPDYFKKADCREYSHWHNSYELLYFTGPDTEFLVNGFTYRPGVGDILLIDSFDIHKNIADAPDHQYVFLIDLTQLPFAIESPLFPSSSPDKWLIKGGPHESFRSHIARHLEKLIELNHTNIPDEASAYETFGEMMYLIGDIHRYTRTLDTPIDYEQLRDKTILKKVYKYVASNYHSPITLQEISELAGFSTTYFCKFIKRATGQTFLEFLNTYRCLMARAMIDSTNLSLTTIALDSGFSSISYFSRIFSRTFGISPSVYKKNSEDRYL